jgi:hypothetical protein
VPTKAQEAKAGGEKKPGGGFRHLDIRLDKDVIRPNNGAEVGRPPVERRNFQLLTVLLELAAAGEVGTLFCHPLWEREKINRRRKKGGARQQVD